jgi:very-short-patch-repair endonuclease
MVRNRRCCGVKFRREFRVDPYTVDFCCVELKLITEVDGKSHFTDAVIAADRGRDEYLRRLGYEVLRIPGFDVLKEPGAVRDKIVKAIHRSGFPPHPQPLSPEH